jgi:MFS family permease
LTRRNRLIFWASVVVLLIAAIATLVHADTLTLWSDEIWSVFHTSGTTQQVFQDQDVTWPFGYYLALHLWTQFATNNDFSLHVFGALIGLLTTACIIRAGRRLLPGSRELFAAPVAGLLAGLAFATSSYALYFQLEVRGYGLMLLAEAAFVWLFLRWHARPTRWRGAVLLVAQIMLMYTQFILFVIIGLAGVYTVMSSWRRADRRRIGYWLLITILTGIAFLPLLSQFLRGFRLRANIGGQPLPNYFLYPFDSFYHAYSAHSDVLFGLILLFVFVGLILGLTTRRMNWSIVAWLGVWAIAIPVAAYVTKEQTASFTTRYLTFTMPAAFLLIGLGLAALPRRVMTLSVLAVFVLATVPWQPYEHRPHDSDTPPVGEFMRAMNTYFQPGDQLLVDPGCNCVDPITWAYYQSLYCSHCGIQPITDRAMLTDLSHTARRIWLLVRQGNTDNTLAQAVSTGRITRKFWGPWYFIATLYESPPLDQAKWINFGDSIQFGGAQITRRAQLESGDNIVITLWWSIKQPIGDDYSISVRLIDPNGKLVIQSDGTPHTAGTPDALSSWQPGALYLDTRQLAVPFYQRDGDYTLQLVVYQWRDGVRLVPAQQGQSPKHMTADQTLILDSAHLISYAVWDAR